MDRRRSYYLQCNQDDFSELDAETRQFDTSDIPYITPAKAGYFKEQILGIEVKSRKGTAVFDADEHVRHDATAEDFKGLRPVFKRDGGA
jgi:hypothetical protein